MNQKRYAMTVDTRVCVACKACVLACKAENEVADGACRTWLVEEVAGRFPTLTAQNRSERCNHCEDAPCVSACPTGASWVADGATVQVDKDLCTGCKACVVACPYGARFMHSAGYVDKCTFCLHRVRDGKEPACVDVCPTRALAFGDRNDPRSEVARQLEGRRHETLESTTGARPNVFFLI